MDRSAWYGLALGVSIGGTYAWLQWRELSRRQNLAEPQGSPGMLWSAMFRMLFLVVALVAVWYWTDADKFWLAGAIAVTYGVWFSWRMRKLLSGDK